MENFNNYFNLCLEHCNKCGGDSEEFYKFISRLNIKQIDKEYLNNINKMVSHNHIQPNHAIVIIMYILNNNNLIINKLENSLTESNLQITKLNKNITNLYNEIKQNKLKILEFEKNNYNRIKLSDSRFKIPYFVFIIMLLSIILYRFKIYIY